MRVKFMAAFLCLVSLAVTSCGIGDPVSFIELKSANRRCNTQAQYLHKLPAPPQRTIIDPETGIETWAWDCSVLRERHADKAAGAPYWYEGYYLDCTYEVDFDPEGNKIDARWIGGGCFNSRGELYRPSFFYNE